jgi:hypothetical protein
MSLFSSTADSTATTLVNRAEDRVAAPQRNWGLSAAARRRRTEGEGPGGAFPGLCTRA